MAYSTKTNVLDHGDMIVQAAGFIATGDDSDFTVDSITFGNTTNILGLATYVATVTVANGATTGKESAIGMPANFLPFAVAVHVTTAATNAVNLNDIGDDADTDSYVDGTSLALNSTGYKGLIGCNGVRGIAGSVASITGALTTADEVEVVISGDPGATGATMRLTFIGVQAS